jgi:hypothetical protein
VSNRLEREFPAERWQTVLPVGRDGLSDDLVRRARARGHQLRSQALRRAGRRVFAAGARVLAQIVTFFHCAAYGIAKRPPEHDGPCAAPRSA